MTQPTLDFLANLIGTQTTIGMDGCSNVDRVRFVMEAMGVDQIDLNEQVDYTLALDSDNPTFVEAAIHLAKLQIQYIAAAHYSGYLTDDNNAMKMAVYTLIIEKMCWHLKHLNMDVPTPPYGFIH